MKLTLLLTILFSIHATADILAQRISLKVENEKLENVLKEMRRQSGYAFIYNSNYLVSAKPVTLQVAGEDIRETLTLLFADQPFTFTIKDKVITIVPKTNSKAIGQQPGSISGTVTDSLNNPLQNVTVQVIGTSLQTSTDRDGRYNLSNVPQDARLSFRLLSYKSFEMPVDRPVINVVLKFQYSFLDETEVRGYYNTTRRFSTGNVNTVTASEIAKQPIGNPISSLQGRVPGVFIEQQSGLPGKSWSIEVRGRNSIANGNDPLYIIDGVPFPSRSMSTRLHVSSGFQSPLNSINPADIESISILKDADATAIYGSQWCYTDHDKKRKCR